jgi:hypothetical protein
MRSRLIASECLWRVGARTSWDGTIMKHSSFRVFAVVAVLSCLCMVGCQSSPRWAWWKKDAAPEDQSLLARSAAPALPSAQATPQAVESSALQPASPPSSANLAATGGGSATGGSMIPASSAATLANAPPASYPTDGSDGGSLAAPMSSLTPSATPPQTTAQVPAAGPYDPNAYQPSAALTAATSSPASESGDRYSLGAGGMATDRYAAGHEMTAPTPGVTPPPPTSALADRYNLSSTPPATTGGAMAPTGAPEVNHYDSAERARYAAASPPTVETAPAPAATVTPPAQPSTTVQVSSSAGQYRPGGTSSYTVAPMQPVPTQPVRVATQPGPASGGEKDLSAPTHGSVPWSPPASSPGTASEYRAY